jgi:hypothetical protein
MNRGFDYDHRTENVSRKFKGLGMDGDGNKLK